MSHEYPYSIKRHGTTLEKCEDEPVQTPGCVQAHGVLLVLRRSDLTILQVSENSRDWLGLSPEQLLKMNISIAVGKAMAGFIRHAIDCENLDHVRRHLSTLSPRKQRNRYALDVSLNVDSGLILLELEAAAASDTQQPPQVRRDLDHYGLVRSTLTRFQEAYNLKMLTQAIAEEVRRITEMDRVMVYFFHADSTGEVIAESKRQDKVSWLGWRYPAHDIPPPAREIFKKVWSRPVPDVRAGLFEIVPLLNPDTQKPLDMTYCSLRGASVMYTEYLDNMGVRAALTLPLMREGKLWGLIACHHDTPMPMSYRMLAAAELLARVASLQIRLAEEGEDTEYRLALEAANYALISKVALAPELSAFTEGAVHLGTGLNCGGAAIFLQGSWSTVGQTPEISQITDLGHWLLTQPACQEGAPHPIFVTDHLSQSYPAAKKFTGNVSGLMAYCFSRDPLGLILYFRPETLQTLTWAGNPNELPVIAGPHGPRLSPRKSFELWRETVRERSMPWKTVEIEASLKLRSLIVNMLISKAEQVNSLRSHVAARTRELAASEARLQAVLTAATEYSIIACDAKGIITVFNSGAERMLGYTADEMVGKQKPTVLHLESELAERGRELTKELGRTVEGFDVFGAKAHKGQLDERLWTYVRKDGSRLLVQLTASVAYDENGELIGFVAIGKDFTARNHYEQQLQEAKDHAEHADRAKSEFLATMSHEIRTPMNGVIGMTGLLLDTRLDTEQRNVAETIRFSGESLLRLINDLLDFSKIEAGQMTLEELDFDLRDLVEDTAEMMAIQAHAKAIELVCDVVTEIPAKLRGDPGRVRQVLANLIGNAIKFTKEGEVAVRATVEAETEANVLVRFEIQDTGMGISPETQARLFHPFVQADSSTSRKFGGSGLGLAICKRLAESMNGSIGVESTPGVGSTFWVTMKFFRRAGARVEPQIAPELANTRVLLVMDSATRRQFFHQKITALRMFAQGAESGQEALAMLRQAVTEGTPYPLAIVDLQKPGMDGLAFAQELKEDSSLGATRLILLAPFGNPIPRDRLKASNVAACCVKPVRQSMLFDCISEVLTRSTGALESAQPEPLIKSGDSAPLRKERVLLAEDNLVNQQVALGNLRKLGYNADVASNGFEVLEAIARKSYDIILMDCQMPELDGYQVTKEIRQNERKGLHAYIIAMTANAMVGDREKCLAAGMDDYVSKPLNRAELRAALLRGHANPIKPFNEEVAVDDDCEFRKWIDLFAATAPGSIANMKRALGESNAGDLSMAAHSLKGSCSNFGAATLAELCAQIEHAADDGALSGLEDIIACAETELVRVIEALKTQIKPKHSL